MLNRLSYFPLLKRLACLFVIVLLSVAANAQVRKKPYTLLWRISGKDLKAPSYLFGTMHVKDRRVFGFSDSVMLAIQKCKSFSLEVHPDSTIRMLFDLMGKPDTSQDLHKMLTEEQYKKLSEKFKDRNGYDLREGMSPFLAETMMQSDREEKPDDRESFIDAYLYGIARTMHKNIYGLEKISDQLNKLIGSSGEIRDRLVSLLENGEGDEEDDSEAMVKVYSRGNLDDILIYINRYMPVDSEIIARNKVMASGIVRHAHEAPIFVAVGAAHLPGDDGVIALLRNEGYTVEPVDATFTGVASKFHIDENSMSWVTHKDDEMGYSLDFPAQPLKTSIYAVPTWLYTDLATENFFGIYIVREGAPDSHVNRQQVLDKLLKNMARDKGDQIISRKDIAVNGLSGVDIVTKSPHQYERSEVFVKNNILYYLYMGNQLNSSLHTAAANRFFNSFKTYKLKLPEQAPAGWIDFKHDTGAFTVKLPVQPTRVSKQASNPKRPDITVNLNLFVAIDTIGMNNYLVRYSDFALGNYMADKEKALNSLAEDLSANAQVIGKAKVIWLDGYEGRELKLIFEKRYKAVVRIYVRGGRTYMLLKEDLHDGEEVKTDDVFFNSFKFIPYIKPAYIDYESKDLNFKIKMVGETKVVRDSAMGYSNYAHSLIFFTTNSPASGGNYTVEHYNISKYYRAPDADSLYRFFAKRLVKYTDTLIKLDTVTIDGKKARELITQNLETKDKRRTRVLIDGGEIFYLESHLANEELFNEASNTFFNSLQLTGDAAKIDLPASKAKLIADGLASTDTTVAKEAKGALNFYTFKKDELPEVYRALSKSYPDDTIRTGVRYKLVEALSAVHDSTTLGELQNVFAGLQGKDLLRSIILYTIPHTDSVKGYDSYFKLLTETKPLKLKDNFNAFSPLYDSLDYTASHFQQLLPLATDSAYFDNIITLASRLASQDKPEYTKLLKDNFDILTQGAYDELVKYTNSKDTTKNEYDINTYKYLNLMGVVTGKPLTAKFTGYYLQHYPAGDFVSDAVITRIANHLPVSDKTLMRLLDDMSKRYEVMEAYNKHKQMDKIPLKYKTQTEFGRLCLYKNIGSDNDDDNDYGNAEKLMLVGSVTDKGSVYYAYKFKQSQRDSVATYIGIAGPFKTGSTDLNFKRYYAYTDYTIKGVNWMKQAKAMIPKLREAYDLDKKKDQTKDKK